MADPLLDLIFARDDNESTTHNQLLASASNKYLSRLLSLRPSDLTTSEPQSLSQSSHSTLLSIQALSSRSQRSIITSSDQLATLSASIPALNTTITSVKNAVPALDESAINFASKYSRTRPTSDSDENNALSSRKEAMLFSRQSEKLQDILELPILLRTAITSAASGAAGSANYSQALDLIAHIKRLRVLYPDSELIASVHREADEAMKDMTKNLLQSLRGQNVRLAAAIRTIGWVRRVVPELGTASYVNPTAVSEGSAGSTLPLSSGLGREEEQSEGSLGALFLVARLSTFLSMTEDALAPLRDLADQETEKRLQSARTTKDEKPRKGSHIPASVQGQQTERYLKRYIEIFREQSFATIQMYRNVFPQSSGAVGEEEEEEEGKLKLPSALASFPLHLVSLLMETLQTYLPNITDVAARESLLIQVLYAANSLGRLGADFSMLISLLDLPESDSAQVNEGAAVDEETQKEPEWYRVIKKHRVQAARLDALASGQENAARRVSQDIAVR